MDYKECPFGETVLTPISDGDEANVCITDASLDFAIIQRKESTMRYVINGKEHSWHEEVSGITFQPFPGYFYNFKDGSNRSYNFSGKDNPAQNLTAYDITVDGKAICIQRNERGVMSTLIGGREIHYNLYGNVTLTCDNKGFLYQATDNSEDRNFFIVENNTVLHEGYVSEIRIFYGRKKYAWIGSGKEYDYPYIDSKRIDHPIDGYEAGTFIVSESGARYLLFEQRNPDVPAVLVVDGKRKSIQCDGFFDNDCCMFNSDGTSYCVTCSYNEKAILVCDDKVVARYHEIFDTVFVGSRLFYVGYDEIDDRCFVCMDDIQRSSWPYIEQYTMITSDDGEHYCFCGNEYGLKSEESQWHFVVDGKSVWKFDALPKRDCGYFFPSVYPVQFVGDSVYLVAIKNSNLVLYHHRL